MNCYPLLRPLAGSKAVARLFTRLTVCLAFAAGSVCSRATTVIPPQLTELASQADYVVRAVVKSVKAEWRTSGESSHIITSVELEVSEVIAGTPPTPLVLEILGGKIDDVELVVQGAPTFAVGDEDILFIRGNGTQFYPLVGVMHGVYPVYHDATANQDYVLRSNGSPLYQASDVSLSLHDSNAQAAKSSALPMRAGDFVTQIKAARSADATTTPTANAN